MDIQAKNRLTFASGSASVTEQIGEHIGNRLRGGEVIELVSDLGGGKTTFVRGLAQGLGSADHVTSPTFKISNVYKAGNLELHHFDFYRLQSSGIVGYELNDVLGGTSNIIVIEWADVVQHVLPAEKLTVTFSKDSEEGRQLTFSYPAKFNYLVKDL